MAELSSNLTRTPAEILQHIAEYLRTCDLNRFSQATRRFYLVLSSLLYDRALYHSLPPARTKISPLIWAIRNGKHEVIRQLIQRGVDPSIKFFGTTALHEAVIYREEEVLKQLLQLTTNVSPRSYFMETSSGTHFMSPLMLAAEHNQVNFIQMLLDAGAGIDVEVTGEWHLALTLALNGGHASACLSLLDAAVRDGRIASDSTARGTEPRCRAEKDQTQQETQKTLDVLLRAAAYRGLPTVLKRLLQHGAAVNSADEEGNTALHWAVYEAAHIIPCLLEAGADPKIANNRGHTPLHIALHWGLTEAACILINQTIAPFSPEALEALHFAIIMNRYRVIRVLAGAGIPLNSPLANGRTALHIATNGLYTTSLRALLDCGADTSVTTPDKITPLHLATRESSHVVVQLLLDAGADISARSLAGDTCLHIAARRGQPEVAEILVREFRRRDMELDTICGAGYTVLETAVRYRWTFMVELLLAHGVNTQRHGDHSTALHQAFMRHRCGDIAELLLDHGADLYMPDLYGRSAFDWAATQSFLSSLVSKHSEVGRIPLPVDEQTAILKRSVCTIVTRVAEGFPMEGDFARLGRCLLFLKDVAGAGAAFAYEISSISQTLLVTGEITDSSELDCACCGRGPEAQTGLQICVSCGMTILCDRCIQSYGPGDICRRHQFMKILDKAQQTVDLEAANNSTCPTYWLQNLLATFS